MSGNAQRAQPGHQGVRAAFCDATAHQAVEKSRTVVSIEAPPPGRWCPLPINEPGNIDEIWATSASTIQFSTTEQSEDDAILRGVRDYTLRIGFSNDVTCGRTIPIMLPLDPATGDDAEGVTAAAAAADMNTYKIQFNSTCLDATHNREVANRVLHTT